MSSAPLPARRGRPFGVTAIAILQVASALASVGAGLLMLMATGSGVTTLLDQMSESRAIGLGQLGLLVVEGIADLISAVGLLRMQRWAWVLVMLLVGYSLATNLWVYFSGNGAPYLDMVLNVVIVFYLNQRDVRRAFGHHDRNRSVHVPVQRKT